MASRFWGVAPWELEAHPECFYWTARALQIQKAESAATEIIRKAAEKRKPNG